MTSLRRQPPAALRFACLNARDRNALGFRRDLLTGAAYGVDEFLFVYGHPHRPTDRTLDD